MSCAACEPRWRRGLPVWRWWQARRKFWIRAVFTSMMRRCGGCPRALGVSNVWSSWHPSGRIARRCRLRCAPSLSASSMDSQAIWPTSSVIFAAQVLPRPQRASPSLCRSHLWRDAGPSREGGSSQQARSERKAIAPPRRCAGLAFRRSNRSSRRSMRRWLPGAWICRSG